MTKNKLMNSIALSLTLITASVPAFALDTIEPYSPGLSKFEAYYSTVGGKTHSGSGVVGYGGGQYLNPALSFGATSGAYGFGLQNLSNVYSGAAVIDLIPYVNYSRVTVLTQSIGFSTLGLKSEFTFPMGNTTPYLQLDLGKAFVTGSKFGYAANLGVSQKFYPEGETFFQVGYNGSTSLSVGHNHAFTPSWEGLLDAGYDLTGKNFMASLGVIFVLK